MRAWWWDGIREFEQSILEWNETNSLRVGQEYEAPTA
jgi:hypothetical protein